MGGMVRGNEQGDGQDCGAYNVGADGGSNVKSARLGTRRTCEHWDAMYKCR